MAFNSHNSVTYIRVQHWSLDLVPFKSTDGLFFIERVLLPMNNKKMPDKNCLPGIRIEESMGQCLSF
jgi:hypothetical protein